MQKGQNGNAVYYLSFIIVVFFLGCSVKQRHSALTFFFDGVDNAGFFNDYLSKDSVSKDAIAKREQLLQKVRPDLFVHRPFKEKKCEQCHTPDKHLKMAMPGLCFQCHKNFTETYSYVHGPAGSGSCLKCHNQHSSKYPKLLIRQGQQICLYCHSSALVFKTKYHRDIEDAECTMCHNPHGGSNRFMVKDAIVKNLNGFLMNSLGTRHLYAQVFFASPGDFTKRSEIAILNDDGEVVSSAYTDLAGRFSLVNLHPDENYTFRCRELGADAKINISDNEGAIVYVVEKNKKGRYTFDKSAYETAHTKINAANPVSAELRKEEPGSSLISPDIDKLVGVDKKTETGAGIAGQQDGVSSPRAGIDSTLPRAVDRPSQFEAVPASNVAPESATGKGKIVVKALPDQPTAEERANLKKPGEATSGDKPVAAEKAPDTASYKGKIVVKNLPDDKAEAVDSRKSGNAASGAKKYKATGLTLEKLAEQIAPYYGGTIVCVLNDSEDLLGIGNVNEKGNFLLNDFLPYYHINLPEKSKGILSQIVFLNSKMEVIKTINRRPYDGQFLYEPCSVSYEANVMEISGDKDARPFSSIYFDNGKSDITPSGKNELNKIAEFLIKNPQSSVLLVAYSSSKNNAGLSADRVKASQHYLESQGVRRSRISGRGYRNAEQGDAEKNKGTGEGHRANSSIDIFIK